MLQPILLQMFMVFNVTTMSSRSFTLRTVDFYNMFLVVYQKWGSQQSSLEGACHRDNPENHYHFIKKNSFELRVFSIWHYHQYG